MRQFEMRFFDRLGVPILMRVHTAADDLAALVEAERLSVTHTIEVWEGNRLVARVKKGYAPIAETERRAL
jgi:hypothetical protein